MVRDHHEIRMGRFRPLFDYLQARADEETVSLTFAQLEEILGFALPAIARIGTREWWTVNPVKVQARSWQAAGRHPHPDEQHVHFVRSDSIAWVSSSAARHSAERRRKYALDRLNDQSADEQFRREVSHGWWEPHLVYVIHYAEAGLYKVGLTHHATDRIRDLVRIGGVVVETLNVPNRWVASVLENEVLLSVNDARVEPPLWIAQVAGPTEFWRDDVKPAPLLKTVLATIGDVTRHWGTSIDRAAAHVSSAER